jgi:hypothetical protein
MPGFLFTAAAMWTGAVCAGDVQTFDSTKVPPLTRFLEEHPFDQQAPAIRAALIQWEADSKDVVDVVCPGVFAPLPDRSIKYSSELLVQFIFGSAAHQLLQPGDKGKLMPAQLAGAKSMLKAYRSMLVAEKDARIPRFDELSRNEADGSLERVLTPLVIENCLPGDATTARFPWTFGMTHAQVSAVEGYGPYRSFSNGDLETYNAVFDGRFENFQFFFRDDKLARIGVYTFEGRDLAPAVDAWGDLYVGMQRSFGAIETPGNISPTKNDAQSMEAFKSRARELLEKGGKPQMAPVNQPGDTFSFASLNTYDSPAGKTYFVTLFFDPPDARGNNSVRP